LHLNGVLILFEPKTSKIFKLKKWLTIAEAARHLTGVCGEVVTGQDIFRLALDGHIELSINFLNPIPVRFVSWVDTNLGELPEGFEEEDNLPHIWATLDKTKDSLKFLKFEENNSSNKSVYIRDIWDLPIDFNEKVIQKKYQEIIGNLTVKIDDSNVILVENYEFGQRCVLQSYREAPVPPHNKTFHIAPDLPEDSIFVVTTSAIRKFEQSLNDDQEGITTKKVHGNSERNARKREEDLGAALAVLAKWPENCQAGSGSIKATKIRELIESKGYLFWREDGDPPLKTSEIENLIREWLRKTGE
jgi:hypothetical protein